MLYMICYCCVQKLEKELHKLTQEFVQCLDKLLNVTDEASRGKSKRSTSKSAYMRTESTENPHRTDMPRPTNATTEFFGHEEVIR